MIEYKPDYYINKLKEEFNLLAIKAEFEAEGSTIEELAELSNMCTSSEIPLTLKIGGPSAQRELGARQPTLVCSRLNSYPAPPQHNSLMVSPASIAPDWIINRMILAACALSTPSISPS